MIPRRRLPIHVRDWSITLRALSQNKIKGFESLKRFEEHFATGCQARLALTTASGRMAMLTILQELGVGPGDQILIPAYTLGELIPLIQALGIEPRAVDVDPDNFTIDPAEIERHIGPKTRAIMVVHLFGVSADMLAIMEIAERHGLAVIEDCAHTYGTTINGHPIGTFGDASFFSLEPTKPIPAYGGGVIVSNSQTLIGALKEDQEQSKRSEWPFMRKMGTKWAEEALIRSPLYAPIARHLFSEKNAARFNDQYRHSNQGLRSNFPSWSAARSLLGLARLDDFIPRRNALLILRDQIIANLPASLRPQKPNQTGDSYYPYNLALYYSGDIRRLRTRALSEGLDIGIGAEVMDDTAQILNQDGAPNAANLFRHIIQIPFYSGLGDSEVKKMSAILRRIV